ncbi:MAG: biotin/lipoyl-binding protein [Eubacterium ramulus]
MSERTEKMKQKQWVQIAAVFFGLMIVLTICSRAASSAVKARVTVTRASRQKISHEISLNGSVEAKNYVLQYVTSGLMVTGVQVSPGQQVEAGDVIFTVDMQKLQESIASIETERNRVDEKERLSVSRAEAAYQDVKANAEEEKALAYQTYEKAVAEYQNYINTHKKTAGVSAESTEERTMNEKAASIYDEAVAKELEDAVEAGKSTYEAVVREQEKQISAAADVVQQTKEDLNLSRDTDTLEEQLKKLRACAENGGVYRAEYTGVVGQLNVTAGTETAEGIAVMLADRAETVRFVAEVPEEYVDEISGDSVITLHGKNMSGIQEDYELSSATVSGNDGSRQMRPVAAG